MRSQRPSPGRIVQYVLTAADAQAIDSAPGHHNPAHEGDVYPALIVRVFGSTPDSAANLQVFYDGDGSIWATSRIQGDGPEDGGCWFWPERV